MVGFRDLVGTDFAPVSNKTAVKLVLELSQNWESKSISSCHRIVVKILTRTVVRIVEDNCHLDNFLGYLRIVNIDRDIFWLNEIAPILRVNNTEPETF